MASSSRPVFSIVIPALNEEKALPQLLTDLAHQTFPIDQLEVFLVDGRSDDKTVEVAKQTARSLKLPLTVLSSPVRHVAAQRNLGAQRAKADWLIFMDADNRLPDYFLDGIRYQIAKNPTDLFSCQILPDNKTGQSRTIARVVNSYLALHGHLGFVFALGSMIGAKRQVFQKVTFDQTHRVGEDGYFVAAAEAAGFSYTVFSEPRYVWSLRRLRREGVFKIVLTQAAMTINLLNGDEFRNNDCGYVMKGGSYYDQESPTIFSNLLKPLQKLSRRQLTSVRRLIKKQWDELS